MLEDVAKIIYKFIEFSFEKEIKNDEGRNQNKENIKFSFLTSPENLDSHFSSNFLMVLTPISKKKPEEIFVEFENFLKSNNIFENFESIFFTRPGFVNFKIKKQDIFNFFLDISFNSDKNLVPNIGNEERINIEYVSCNPTGPMHIGHTRNAIVGDGLCSLFKKVKYNVFQEFCINDNGNQFEKLVESIIFRYKNLNTTKTDEELFQEMIKYGMYPGDYVIEIAKAVDKNIKNFNNLEEKEKQKFIKELALKEIMQNIKSTLRRMKIKHDDFISVQNLIDNENLSEILQKLKDKDLIYEGQVDKEKAESTEQAYIDAKDNDKFLLFRSTYFGDDKDRVLLRKDKSLTYFAGDLIYHKNKIERGFDKMVLLLGEDHKGYEKRMKAIVKSLKETANIDIVLTNLVKFQKDGEEIKMSKRKGNFLTTEDVLDEISIDVLRFIILSYKKNTNITFDFEKSISQSKENPVFYVQYGYSRICSILRKIDEIFPHFKSIDRFEEIQNINLAASSFFNFDKIFSKIIFYPESIKQAVKQFDPSVLISYTIELAGLFHSAWNFGSDNNVKFVTEDEKEAYKNYIILKSIKNIIKSILDIFKIEAMERM